MCGVLVAGCLPSQPPPFERHPHPAGDEGNATAKVAPSGLGQCHVVEPESARARPGSHDTHGQGLLERDQVWRLPYDTHGQGLLDRAQVWRLPLHYRYIMLPRCLPAHAPLSTTPLSTPPCPAAYHPMPRCLPPSGTVAAKTPATSSARGGVPHSRTTCSASRSPSSIPRHRPPVPRY